MLQSWNASLGAAQRSFALFLRPDIHGVGLNGQDTLLSGSPGYGTKEMEKFTLPSLKLNISHLVYKVYLLAEM